MALKTAEQYKESLRDGRVVYYKGEKVADVTTHPDLSVCVNTMAIDYEMAEDPKYRELAVVDDPEFGPISRYYHIPKNGDDLLKAHELIVTSTALSDGYIPLGHDIGADALNAIAITAHTMGNQDTSRKMILRSVRV
jgi:4-hydroxybutyryl-CoA dehydratase/vinylacetyl-CoA-Delta-isomerase